MLSFFLPAKQRANIIAVLDTPIHWVTIVFFIFVGSYAMSDIATLAELKINFEIPISERDSELSHAESEQLQDEIVDLLTENDATLVAHYYCDPLVQALAERSGGFIGDSLEMARYGRDVSATTVMVAGVKFMGETAKILSPEKRILMPTK